MESTKEFGALITNREKKITFPGRLPGLKITGIMDYCLLQCHCVMMRTGYRLIRRKGDCVEFLCALPTPSGKGFDQAEQVGLAVQVWIPPNPLWLADTDWYFPRFSWGD